jgi:hypothetical protein
VGKDAIFARLDGRVDDRDCVAEGGVVGMYVGVVGCVFDCDRGGYI